MSITLQSAKNGEIFKKTEKGMEKLNSAF